MVNGHQSLALYLTEEVLGALRLRLNLEKTRVVDFERGFRFLGVEFVRNLVLQCRTADEPADLAETILPEEPGADVAVPLYVETEAVLVEAEPAIQGALTLALTEALEQKQENRAPGADAEEGFAIDEEEPTADSDPVLRTLFSWSTAVCSARNPSAWWCERTAWCCRRCRPSKSIRSWCSVTLRSRPRRWRSASSSASPSCSSPAGAATTG